MAASLCASTNSRSAARRAAVAGLWIIEKGAGGVAGRRVIRLQVVGRMSAAS
jgi:hypothetical protein